MGGGYNIKNMKSYLIESGKLKKYRISNPCQYHNDLVKFNGNSIESFKVIFLEDNLFPRLFPKLIFGQNEESCYIFKIDIINKCLEYLENLPDLNLEYYINLNWKNEIIRISDLSPYESEDLIYSYYLEYKLKLKRI